MGECLKKIEEEDVILPMKIWQQKTNKKKSKHLTHDDRRQRVWVHKRAVWFYYALLLIAIGTSPSSAQTTPSCNQVHLLINTNSYEHTASRHISSKDGAHTPRHASANSAGPVHISTGGMSAQIRRSVLEDGRLNIFDTLVDFSLDVLDSFFSLSPQFSG